MDANQWPALMFFLSTELLVEGAPVHLLQLSDVVRFTVNGEE